MRIAILGGSFDPPHVGHDLIARQVKELFSIDQIWLMPAFIHPFQKKMSPVKKRLEMLKFLENDFIKVSTLEIHEEKTSYTINTLEKLSKIYPRDTFYWIIGSDQLKDIKKWKDWKILIVTFNIIIFPRFLLNNVSNNHIKTALNLKTIPKNMHIANNKNLTLINVSSTEIRNRVQSKKSIKNLVPEKIEEYIKKNKLYE